MYMQHAAFAIMPPYLGLSGLACSTLNPIDWGLVVPAWCMYVLLRTSSART